MRARFILNGFLLETESDESENSTQSQDLSGPAQKPISVYSKLVLSQEIHLAQTARLMISDLTSTLARMIMPASPPPEAPFSSFHRFYDLPPEIRLHILSYITDEHGELRLGADLPSSLGPHSNTTPAVAPLDLFLASPALYAEAAPLWHANPLHFNLTTGTSPLLIAHMTNFAPSHNDDNPLVTFFSPQCRPSRLRVRRVVLHLHRIGGFYSEAVGPALAEMVLEGNLRDIEVRMEYGKRMGPGHNVPPKQHDAKDDERIAASKPFRMLLKLLADPYLERTAVKVWKSHWTLWCPFHEPLEEEKCPLGATRKSTMEDYYKWGWPRDGWVDIDVKALLGRYGTDEKILRID